VAVLDCGYGGVINPTWHIMIHLGYRTAAVLHSIIETEDLEPNLLRLLVDYVDAMKSTRYALSFGYAFRDGTPIKGGLDAFARSFKTSCDGLGIARPFDPAALEQHKGEPDILT
jgi:hypothetical protein